MKAPEFLNSWRPVTYRGYKISKKGMPSVTDRQERIKGYDQQKLKNSIILAIGAGGLGSEIGEGVVRKGIGKLILYDPDYIDITNLNRQKFYPKDIGKNKAICLSKNLKNESTCGTFLQAFPYAIEKHIEENKVPFFNVAVIGVDSYDTRLRVSEYLLKVNKPGIFLGVSEDTDRGYIFVQEHRGPCFSCIFPRHKDSGRKPCPSVPAVKDILKTVVGPALFAIDSILMNLKRNWNFWLLSLSGYIPDIKFTHEKRLNCELCSIQLGVGGKNEKSLW